MKVGVPESSINQQHFSSLWQISLFLNPYSVLLFPRSLSTSFQFFRFQYFVSTFLISYSTIMPSSSEKSAKRAAAKRLHKSSKAVPAQMIEEGWILRLPRFNNTHRKLFQPFKNLACKSNGERKECLDNCALNIEGWGHPVAIVGRKKLGGFIHFSFVQVLPLHATSILLSSNSANISADVFCEGKQRSS